jgi:putative membrane protein
MSRTVERPLAEASSTDLRRARRGWSWRIVGAALVLAAWAGLFWFLILADRVDLYLSTRTSWVVPMAAGLLSIAALGTFAAARSSRSEALGLREGVVMSLLAVPVVLLVALPPATLGTFSASKKATFSGSSAGFFWTFDETSEVTLLMVAAAQTSDEGSKLLARRAGEEVAFVGFVARNADTPADEILLTRYVITCCAADATVVQVRVVNVTPARFEPEDWVEVRGQIYPIGRQVIVNASSVEEVARPEKPYLTP